MGLNLTTCRLCLQVKSDIEQPPPYPVYWRSIFDRTTYVRQTLISEATREQRNAFLG